ncbi:MAG: PQQ-binding-like beta-propeller repeat protein [Planctomycetota bacterium]
MNDGNIYAADIKSGQTRWEFPTGSAVVASPAVAKGKLVIGTQDGTIYCFGSSAR